MYMLAYDFECRKPKRSIWRNGDRRRSPRISAKVDDTEEKEGGDHEKEGGHQKGGGSSSKSRARMKRKFNHNEMESSQDGDKQQDEDQLPTCGKFIKLPEKPILELILDTLQRRDVHEIFAEPVDPDEVEDYYEIIEHPMDFGTMRAKLHEGMYQNLEQFEHDVFLIPRNAMHFNTSSSIYFRQARGIYELAEKLFHVLKTDPEHFELEFPRERRRTMTRAMGKSKSLDSSMGSINQGSKYSDSGPIGAKKRQGRQGVDACTIRKDTDPSSGMSL
ncbi:chromatin/chromatin-binding, or -regulatory protein [Lithospermum erythrorhizon]|uniref:Chromatin/chromatin-binding, or -regulatory protein n=1 Tax=Lithospermum erythrorhizon TaxID=34254 RepID=A0AAV3P6F4_LITER